MKKLYLLLLLAFSYEFLLAQNTNAPVLPAAYRTQVYVPMLKGKRIGIFANHTATVGNQHLVDTLIKLGIKITKAFGPEHGFRGTADAGEKIDNYNDPTTGIPVISLYGKKRRPSAEDLADVDIMLFDIQDVGVRYYTFISSLQEYMEAAFEYKKSLIILDRPNPNGFYVDGPILDTAYKSFIGMQPVPVVYGMTIGEYAMMIAGENWLKRGANNSVDTPFHFQVIKCANYTHQSTYTLPVKPSPNLPDMAAIYWYGSTCYFEGTVLSEGRGTDHPFCIFGHPSLPKSLYAFTPISRDGAKEPKLKNMLSYGWNIWDEASKVRSQLNSGIRIDYLVEAYRLFPQKDSFFLRPKSGKLTDYFFNKLAGSDQLMKQLQAGLSADAIKASWQPGITAFKKIRKKYLLYPDFE